MQELYLRSGTSVRAETLGLFPTQMYVSSVQISVKSVRSIEQRFAVAGRGLGAMPPMSMLEANPKIYRLRSVSLLFVIRTLFSHCSTQTSHPTLYQCPSQLSISLHRVRDAMYSDCFPWQMNMHREEENSTPENAEMACDLPDRFRCGKYQCIPSI